MTGFRGALLVLLMVPVRQTPTTVTISITDPSFAPQVATVAVGDEVVWRNDGHESHSVIGDPLLVRHRSDIEPPIPPEPFHSADLVPGAEFRRVFRLEGVYRYVCLQHEDQGMNGTVIVRRP